MTLTFKGKTIHLKGKPLEVGQKAPDFKLTKADLSEISLEDLGPVTKVLNIVPSLDTGVCSTSAKKFNDKLKGKEVLLVNISMDLPFAQDRFCKASGIENGKTLSAFRSSFGEDYGVLMQDGPLAHLLSRVVVLLDKNNKVLYIEKVPEITQEPNYDAALKALSL